jgi:phage tail sheath protein FI
MPEYLAPGVYIEEVSSGVRPIEGVGTSTTGFVGGTERGPLDPRFVSSFAEFQRLYGGLTDPEETSYLPFAVRGFFENGGRRAFVVRAVGRDPNGGLGADTLAAASPAGAPLSLRAVGPGAWGNRIRAFVQNSGTPTNGDQTARFKLIVAHFSGAVPDDPQPDDADDPEAVRRAISRYLARASYSEEFDKLDVDPTSTSYVATALKIGSKLVVCEPGPDARPANSGLAPIALEGGNAQGLNRQSYLVGLQALEDVDDVQILCVPDQGVVDDPLGGLMVQQCEKLKDRFAILNGRLTFQSPEQFSAAGLTGLSDDGYAAVYHPWIRIYDPLIQDTRLVPPCGHVAGLFARIDNERGVHKAPANEILRGLYLRDVGNEKPLAQTVSRALHERFNPDNINVIRDFRSDGRGIRVYGARTVATNPEWLYVSVRRLFIFVEESIEEGTQWVVFEPNHDPTWAAVRRSISGFLLNVWRSGALVGRTAEEAFFVKCDRETMTQADIDAGRLICLIGIAPVKPAEFVIFRISQKTAEASS